MHLSEPTFPPLLTPRAVKAPLRPLDVACRGAAQGELGAADLVWSRRTDRAEAALVLEPEVGEARALEMLPLLQAALCDSLGALMPPQTAVQFRWPSGLLVNGALAGSTAVVLAPSAPDEVPGWMVLAYSIHVTLDLEGREPGDDLGRTALHAEGGGELDRTRILESVAAHLLTWLNIWQSDGLRAVHHAWIGRLEGFDADAPIWRPQGEVFGRVLGLDDTPNLLVRARDGGTHAVPLRSAVGHYPGSAPTP